MPKYKCLKSHDALIQGQKYSTEDLLVTYDQTTITTLLNAGVIEDLEIKKEVKETK